MWKSTGSLFLLTLAGCCGGPCCCSSNRVACGPLACADSATCTQSATAPDSAAPAPSPMLKGLDDQLVPPIPSEARWRMSPRRSGTNYADETVRRLTADLEQLKSEKSLTEKKLTDEVAKQTQQRLELEARLIVVQQQLQQAQANAIKQAQFQPSQAVIQPAGQSFGASSWGNPSWTGLASNGSSWGTWGSATSQRQASPVDMWPHSPQR